MNITHKTIKIIGLALASSLLQACAPVISFGTIGSEKLPALTITQNDVISAVGTKAIEHGLASRSETEERDTLQASKLGTRQRALTTTRAIDS